MYNFIEIGYRAISKDADIKSAFLQELKQAGIKVERPNCDSCMLDAFFKYKAKIFTPKHHNMTDCKYKLKDPSKVITMHGVRPLKSAQLTDELVERLLVKVPHFANVVERKDGKDVYTFQKKAVETVDDKPTVRAGEATIELAEANGIDINTVEGTGKNGYILKSDVQAIVDAKI